MIQMNCEHSVSGGSCLLILMVYFLGHNFLPSWLIPDLLSTVLSGGLGAHVLVHVCVAFFPSSYLAYLTMFAYRL